MSRGRRNMGGNRGAAALKRQRGFTDKTAHINVEILEEEEDT
jgi:hypothetical protein